MKSIPIFQVDAFASELFRGNPAAVCPLDSWLSDEVMQSIAAENNLSETAFIVGSKAEYHIRWFTPAVEVALCGHATLASAHVIFTIIDPQITQLRFQSQSGTLIVTRHQDNITLDFPADKVSPTSAPPGLEEALGLDFDEVLQGRSDYLVVCSQPSQIEDTRPNFQKLAAVPARGVIITAPGEQADFVSRFFAPASGINEDPVTGSAHCSLTPYWAQRLNKSHLTARQLSSRGGQLSCELVEDRVKLTGKAITYMQGQIYV